ncbi:MAG: ATP-binding cassette domain-containing protein [Acidimicrobiia bacterium]|nr:ATP-binding cassette domain-containing protein [Acidimicrobiia bacterium]
MVAAIAGGLLLLAGNLVAEFTAFEWTLWAIEVILALSLVLVWGYCGIFSFGQAAVYGIGGYAYGVFALNVAERTGETLSALVVAAVAGAVFAAALGYFMFYGNLSNIYVAIVTLATALVVFAIVNSTAGSAYRIGDAVLGGYNGMTRIPRITYRLPGGDPTTLTRVQFFAVCTGVALALALALRSAGRRPFGRIAVAVRENETRSSLLGYDVRRHKLLVFTLGGAIAGLAGGFYAAWGRFMSPTVFSLKPAALVVIWVLVGGRFSVSGAFVGVLVVEGLSSWLGGPSGDRASLLVGALLIGIVLGLRGGVVPTLGRLWREGVRPSLAGAAIRGDPAGSDPSSPRVPESGPRHDRPPSTPASTHPGGEAEVWLGAGAGDEAGKTIEDGDGAPGALLEVHGVSKRFGGVTALDDVTLAFVPRQPSCIIGPNGAGKSTLFGVLTGYHGVTAGTILLNGEDITRLGPHRRARLGLGIKMQVPSVYDALAAQENLWLAAYAASGDRDAAQRWAARILARLGLCEVADLAVGALAHGQRQWLEIGMALATNPSVILLDEPTAGMTRDETERTERLIAQLARHATVVVVEHDMEFVRRLDAPISVLHMGGLFTQGTFEELSRDERVLNIYLGRGADGPTGRTDADAG